MEEYGPNIALRLAWVNVLVITEVRTASQAFRMICQAVQWQQVPELGHCIQSNPLSQSFAAASQRALPHRRQAEAYRSLNILCSLTPSHSCR